MTTVVDYSKFVSCLIFFGIMSTCIKTSDISSCTTLLSFVLLNRTCSRADRRGLCQLCHIGMSQLITDGAMRSTEGNSVSRGLLSSENVGAVLMLPRLESVLQHAVEDVQRSSTQSSHGVSSTCSSKGSVDSGVMLASCDETAAALRQLLALVLYSRHVRQAITASQHASEVASKTDHTVPVQVANFYLITVIMS